MVDQGGRAIPVSATFSPIKNKNETIIAFTAIIRDLSAFTQMQQHLFAVQRFESLGTFLPVAMEVLEDPKADAEFRQRVARLIRDASDTNYATSTIDLNQFIQDLKTLYEETLASTGVQWKTQLNPHLPQLNLNRSGVVQVILNLFLNAVEFSKGIQGASITIGTHFMDQEVLLQMINTGRGMPPEIMDQLFSPGQQAEVLTQNLRLRTARQLLNQMNALMRVDSHPEKGTKVTVKIKMPPT
jgi:two-component system sensor histidine kinase AtoS